MSVLVLQARIRAGSSIDEACDAALAIAQTLRCDVEFEFNGRLATVRSDDVPGAAARRWRERGLV